MYGIRVAFIPTMKWNIRWRRIDELQVDFRGYLNLTIKERTFKPNTFDEIVAFLERGWKCNDSRLDICCAVVEVIGNNVSWVVVVKLRMPQKNGIYFITDQLVDHFLDTIIVRQRFTFCHRNTCKSQV